MVLVYAPIPQAIYSEYVNKHDIHSFFKSTQHTFIDYNQSVGLVDTLHFYDHEHLNHAGVKIFNEHLIEDFKSKGYFTPSIRARRSDIMGKGQNNVNTTRRNSEG